MMKKVQIPEHVMEYFRLTGAQGGKVRARKYSREQISEWGRLGGRSKGSGKKQWNKGGKEKST